MAHGIVLLVLGAALDITGAYKIGLVICVIFLYQVWSTRPLQSLPPVE